jgi:hypothetical protein
MDASGKSDEAALAALPCWANKGLEDARAILDNCSIAVHFVDAEGVIIYANKAELECLGSAPPPALAYDQGKRLPCSNHTRTGYTAAEYLGRNIAEFHVSQETIGDISARLKRRETLINYEVPFFFLAKKTLKIVCSKPAWRYRNPKLMVLA